MKKCTGSCLLAIAVILGIPQIACAEGGLIAPAVVAGGLPPIITYTPAPGVIVFPAGMSGPATTSIGVSTSGGTGGGSTALSCSVTTGFTITSGGVEGGGTVAYAGNGVQPAIGLSCVRGPSTQNGMLNCTEVATPPGTAGVARNWNLTCPAAVAGGAGLMPVPALNHWGSLILGFLLFGYGALVYRSSR